MKGTYEYYLGIGSNIGDLKSNLENALEKIEKIKECKIIKISSFYKSKPWGYKAQNDFLNIVVEIKSNLSPEKMLIHIKSIEIQIGRIITFKNGPRKIDIDILFCGDIILKTETLIIPHPEIENRDFVINPLKEIAPNFIHPISKKRIIDY